MKTLLVMALSLVFNSSVFANRNIKEIPSHLRNHVLKHNSEVRQTFRSNINVARPYAEYEEAGYLIFSDITSHNSAAAKITMSKTLPDHMTLVVFTANPDRYNIQNIRNTYQPYVGQRLLILSTGYGGFWARDGVPIPVFDSQGSLAVVDAKYYHGFESDRVFADEFNAQMPRHNYYFEGGNFIADAAGRCMTVNNPNVAKIPDSVFKKYYGCQKIHRFKHLSGIGHVDEVVKIMDDQNVITDKKEYVADLEAMGFDVTLIPEAKNSFETYVNSLVLDQEVLMPSFGRIADDEAKAVYEDLGFTVHKVDSYRLSNYGKGSLHCITMTYPPVPVNKFIEKTSARLLYNGYAESNWLD